MGLERVLAACTSARVAAGGARRGLTLGRSRFASTALRCSPRGCVAQLATRTAFASLRQARRECLRSALRAPPPGLRSSAPQRSPPPGTACREPRWFVFSPNTKDRTAKARGHWARRASGAPRSAGLTASAKRVRNILVAPCLSGVNAVNAASCATAARPSTAGQSTRSATAPVKRCAKCPRAFAATKPPIDPRPLENRRFRPK